MGLIYYTIDTETNGLKSSYHEINELSIIRCSDKVQLTKFIKCETPERSSYDALRITGKTLESLSQGFDKDTVVNECNKFFEEDGAQSNARVITGHNIISFDKRFLHALWESAGKLFPCDLYLDTINLMQEFIKKSDPSTLKITKTATGKISKTLHASCDMLGIKKAAGIHNSKSDARNSYLLWQKLMEQGINYLPFIKSYPHLSKDNEPEMDLSDIL